MAQGPPAPICTWPGSSTWSGAARSSSTRSTYREAEYRQALLDGVTRALERLEREGVPVDPTRVAVVGHSLGGGLAVDYAASAASARLPVPAAVMSIAPGCASTEVACIGADLGAIAPTSRILLVTAADDPDRIGTLTVERIWAGLGGCRWKTGTW
jgi:dienelactone hydrolase